MIVIFTFIALSHGFLIAHCPLVTLFAYLKFFSSLHDSVLAHWTAIFLVLGYQFMNLTNVLFSGEGGSPCFQLFDEIVQVRRQRFRFVDGECLCSCVRLLFFKFSTHWIANLIYSIEGATCFIIIRQYLGYRAQYHVFLAPLYPKLKIVAIKC